MSTTGPDPSRCPSCGEPTGGGPACVACGLPLTGPLAADLWDVDVRIASLQQRRAMLLERLRAGETTPVQAASSLPHLPPPPPPLPQTQPTAPWTSAPAPRKEWTPQRIQNTLLSLGVLLLAVAALVATAVAYRRVGAGGRAAVLLLVTAIAAAVSSITRKRGLTASAEATGVLSVLLALVTARALRRAGFGDSADVHTYWSTATLLIALASGLLARGQAFAFWVGAALVGQAPLLITSSQHEGATASVILTAQVALIATALVTLRRFVPSRRPALDVVLVVSAALTALAAAGTALDAAYPHGGQVRGGVVALCALALVFAAAGLSSGADQVGVAARHICLGIAVALVTAAVAAPARLAFAESELAAVIAVTALMVAVGLCVVPAGWRLGIGLAAAGTSALSLLLVAPAVVEAVGGPFLWLAHPWQLSVDAAARAGLTPDRPWGGQAGVAMVMLLAAATAMVFAFLGRRESWAGYPAAVLVALAVLVTPLAVDTGYAVALAWDLGVGAAVLLLGPTLRARSRLAGYSGSAVGVGLLAIASAWSVANERTTVIIVAAAAVACAAGAWLDRTVDGTLTAPLAALAAGLAGGEVFAAARSAGAPADRSGFFLAAAAAAMALGYGWLRARSNDGWAVELTGVALLAGALLATSTDPGWTSWTLALAGLAALATALRADRRPVAYGGALLLSASSWVRLADAHVHSPEPYVLPLAALALVLGWLRRRADSGVSSWAAYGPALSLALVPSLVASLDDASARRPLLLAVGAAAVLIVGAVRRLQAPVVVGGGVLAIDAIRQLGAYVALLPRYVVIGGLGLLILLLGFTFEQRRRDMQRLQQAFERMS